MWENPCFMVAKTLNNKFMTTNKEGWEKEYWEKFNNRVGGCFECCEAEKLLDDIKDFITSERLSAQAEILRELEKMLNRCRTEKGLGISLARFIKDFAKSRGIVL